MEVRYEMQKENINFSDVDKAIMNLPCFNEIELGNIFLIAFKFE